MASTIIQFTKPRRPAELVHVEGIPRYHFHHLVCWYENPDEWRAQLASILNLDHDGFVIAELNIQYDYYHGPDILTHHNVISIMGRPDEVLKSDLPTRQLMDLNVGKTGKTSVTLLTVGINYFANEVEAHQAFREVDDIPSDSPAIFEVDESTQNMINSLAGDFEYSEEASNKKRKKCKYYKIVPTGHPKHVDTSVCSFLGEIDLSFPPLPSSTDGYVRRTYHEFWRDVFCGQTCPDVYGDLVIEFIGSIGERTFNTQVQILRKHHLTIKERFENHFRLTVQKPTAFSIGSLVDNEFKAEINSVPNGTERKAVKARLKAMLRVESIKLFDTR